MHLPATLCNGIEVPCGPRFTTRPRPGHAPGRGPVRLAAQLRQHWNLSLWDGVSRLLAEGDSSAPVRRAPRRQRQIQRRLTVEQMDRAIADYVAGDSMGAVARKYRIDRQTVANQLTKRGIDIRKQIGIPDAELENVQALHKAGVSMTEIGRRYGFSPKAVKNALQRLQRRLESNP